jgi:hypothetical protein
VLSVHHGPAPLLRLELLRSSAFGRSRARGHRLRVRGGGGGVGEPAGDEEAARQRGVAVVVRARQARPSEQGEEGMMMGRSCGGGGRGVAPFYRAGEAGRWPVG